MESFVLVVGMFGFTGKEWVYVGNQIVLDMNMTKLECEKVAESWTTFIENKFYKFVIECFSKGNVI